jgi:hypothetical protein
MRDYLRISIGRHFRACPFKRETLTHKSNHFIKRGKKRRERERERELIAPNSAVLRHANEFFPPTRPERERNRERERERERERKRKINSPRMPSAGEEGYQRKGDIKD